MCPWVLQSTEVTVNTTERNKKGLLIGVGFLKMDLGGGALQIKGIASTHTQAVKCQTHLQEANCRIQLMRRVLG